MTLHRRCGAGARRSKPQRPGAPAARRGASPATVRKAWSEAPRDRLGSKRWLSLPSRQGGRPETVRPPGALRSKPNKHRARDALGTADLRLARLKLDRAKAGTDFDKPRCREASRPAGPSGPPASRAPSVLIFGAADLKWECRRTRRLTKNTGDGACLGAYRASPAMTGLRSTTRLRAKDLNASGRALPRSRRPTAWSGP